MSEAQAVALTLNRKPVTAADFLNNAQFYHAGVTAATEQYNVAVAAYNKAVQLENVGAGVTVTFNEGKGDKAETLSGQVITKLVNGDYQVLVQFVGGPAKLSTVKPAAIVAVHAQGQATTEAPAEEVVEQPALTPEFDADASA
jgi:hypothetical protein